MSSKYENYINANPKNIKQFLDSDISRKPKPFENVSYNRKGKQ